MLNLRNFNRSFGLDIASTLIEDFYGGTTTFDEFWNEQHNKIFIKLATPHTITVLHDYIRFYYQKYYLDDAPYQIEWVIYNRDPDEYELLLDSFIKSNSINLKGFRKPDYDSIVKCQHCDKQGCFPCTQLKAYLEVVAEKFEENKFYIIDATFHILVYNRVFLMNFHEKLAQGVNDKLDFFKKRYPQYFDSDNIKRCYLNEWLKDAIYYRDKGICTLGGHDVSGLIRSEGGEKNYDHIVPLDKFGNNDPTNFQILCKKCNDSKKTKINTSIKEIPLWNYDKEELSHFKNSL